MIRFRTPISRRGKVIRDSEVLKPFGVTSPLWAAHTIVLDPKAPRTDEVIGSAEACQFVSVVGAAWLLMGQPAVGETCTFTGTTPAPRPGNPVGDNRSTRATDGHHHRAPPTRNQPRRLPRQVRPSVSAPMVGRRALAPAGVRAWTRPTQTDMDSPVCIGAPRTSPLPETACICGEDNALPQKRFHACRCRISRPTTDELQICRLRETHCAGCEPPIRLKRNSTSCDQNYLRGPDGHGLARSYRSRLVEVVASFQE